MKTITSLIVGMHFHPPAKQVLACLPSGAELLLFPEPENPYDPEALLVKVWAGQVPESVRGDLDECLVGTGVSMDELLAAEEPLVLGHVAKTGGKPLLKAGMQEGNTQFLALMAASPEHHASLTFGTAGEPLVRLSEGRATPTEEEQEHAKAILGQDMSNT